MTSKPFTITTPIYYVNDEPHLGHAYTTVVADVLARYARLQGRQTFFLTGTDEHGQKVQQAAQGREVSEKGYVDQMAVRFRDAWDRLNIAYDDFIRTTEPRHKKVVQQVLQQLWQQGDIYRGEYEGWYCVPDERFWTEKELVDGACPDCGRAVERVVEENYFFRMSEHQEWLVNTINTHPDFVRPESRRNEVLGFLRQPLGDLCISRPEARLSWGIPLPFDEEYVTYVWFDALLNYVTASGYADNPTRFQALWPHTIHLVGKDILMTHAVYWPTMLHAAGLPQPRTIFAHGWWVLEGTKMSKSLGNVVQPLDLVEVYGVDAFRYFLISEMRLGRDATFSEDALRRRYQDDLANDLGNLLHRLTSMVGRYCDNRLPRASSPGAEEAALQERCETVSQEVFALLEGLDLNAAVQRIMETVREINGYLERTQPWHKAREGQLDQVATILYTASEALRWSALLLWPVLPQKAHVLWQQLGWQPTPSMSDGLRWGQLQPDTTVQKGAPLFPRLD